MNDLVVTDPVEAIGVNTLEQLKAAEAALKSYAHHH
jgi:hypothetical protein